MKDIRKGNDIQYKWTVKKLAEVSGDKVVQLISCKTGEVQSAMTYSISGNVINGTFLGKDQNDVGAYRLLLLVNDGHDNMVTLDKVNAFNLTGVCNFGIVRGEDDSSIETVVLEFESELQVNAGINGGEQVQADWNETDPTVRHTYNTSQQYRKRKCRATGQNLMIRSLTTSRTSRPSQMHRSIQTGMQAVVWLRFLTSQPFPMYQARRTRWPLTVPQRLQVLRLLLGTTTLLISLQVVLSLLHSPLQAIILICRTRCSE